ncbi:MAG: DUF2017 family protein [Microthrixaceae bacterium]
MGAPFRRLGDGSVAVFLDDDERALVAGLLAQLRELLTTDSSALRRLFPPPYGDDDERNAGYAALAGAELVERRLAAVDTVADGLELDRLDEEQAMVWMRALNDLRLVLGTVLDITDDEAPPVVTEDNLATVAAYEHLGMLLDALVHALMG